MIIAMPYGSETLEAELSWGRCLGTLDIADAAPLANLDAAVQEAMRTPIGLDTPFQKIVRPGKTVGIVVSDSFRYTGVERILSALLIGLQDAGIREEDILFVIATGTHRAPTEQEKAAILGSVVYNRFQPRVYTHDPDDAACLIDLGSTARGTPVKVNRRVQECDHVIVTGTVVLHYFGGFGGGRKSIVPGIAARETIAHNHALNLHPVEDRLNPSVHIGVLVGNPVAEDMLEAARLCKADYLLNTVLNQQGAIAGIFGGDLEAAHSKAVTFARRLYTASIEEQADLVIASAGEARDFIQSHKALFNAYQAVKPEGRIVFLAKSEEGLGSAKFAEWLALGTRDAIIAELRKRAEINGQTALSTLEKGRIAVLVSGLSDCKVRMLGARKAASLEEALSLAKRDLEVAGVHEPTYYLMPTAAYTVPSLSA